MQGVGIFTEMTVIWTAFHENMGLITNHEYMRKIKVCMSTHTWTDRTMYKLSGSWWLILLTKLVRLKKAVSLPSRILTTPSGPLPALRAKPRQSHLYHHDNALDCSQPRGATLYSFRMKHCQRHNGPESWVHITRSQFTVQSWIYYNFRISTEH